MVHGAFFFGGAIRHESSRGSSLSSGVERASHFAGVNNVRVALEWCFSSGGNVALGVSLAAAATQVFLAMSLLPECASKPPKRCSPRWDDPVRFTSCRQQERIASIHVGMPLDQRTSSPASGGFPLSAHHEMPPTRRLIGRWAYGRGCALVTSERSPACEHWHPISVADRNSSYQHASDRLFVHTVSRRRSATISRISRGAR